MRDHIVTELIENSQADRGIGLSVVSCKKVANYILELECKLDVILNMLDDVGLVAGDIRKVILGIDCE